MQSSRKLLSLLYAASLILLSLIALSSSVPYASAQDSSEQEMKDGPTNKIAQQTFEQARRNLQDHKNGAALDAFKKADAQDDGHCVACQKKMTKWGVELKDWTAAETGAQELVAEARPGKPTARAHYELGMVLMSESEEKHKAGLLVHAHDEFTKAIAAADFPPAAYADGLVLAHMQQDDAAKAKFELFVKTAPPDDPDRQRALRYIARPELVRARMAPSFAVTTLDGRRVSSDDLTGKVVLLDFWATWCPFCQKGVSKIRELTKEFQGQPLIVLSVSVDKDEKKWKDFVKKNDMTWWQYWDGSWGSGPMVKLFRFRGIPHTLTIDSDGVLQDEGSGDAIEGKLKKLVAQAQEAKLQRP